MSVEELERGISIYLVIAGNGVHKVWMFTSDAILAWTYFVCDYRMTAMLEEAILSVPYGKIEQTNLELKYELRLKGLSAVLFYDEIKELAETFELQDIDDELVAYSVLGFLNKLSGRG